MTAQPTRVATRRLDTPLGPMVAGATDDGICLLEFSDRPLLPTQLKRVVNAGRLGTPAPA